MITHGAQLLATVPGLTQQNYRRNVEGCPDHAPKSIVRFKVRTNHCTKNDRPPCGVVRMAENVELFDGPGTDSSSMRFAEDKTTKVFIHGLNTRCMGRLFEGLFVSSNRGHLMAYSTRIPPYAEIDGCDGDACRAWTSNRPSSVYQNLRGKFRRGSMRARAPDAAFSILISFRRSLKRFMKSDPHDVEHQPARLSSDPSRRYENQTLEFIARHQSFLACWSNNNNQWAKIRSGACLREERHEQGPPGRGTEIPAMYDGQVSMPGTAVTMVTAVTARTPNLGVTTVISAGEGGAARQELFRSTHHPTRWPDDCE